MKKILSFFAAMLVAVAVNASTDFAAPGYYCAADDAVITGDAPSNKVYLDESADPHHIAWSDVSKTYTAVIKWTVAATRACYISVSLDLGPTISSNKHIFEVKVLDANGAEVGALEEGPAYTGDGFTDANTVKALTGKIMIPAPGDYTVELRNNRDFCKGSIKNVILTYAGAAPITDFATPGYSCAADEATLSGTVSSSFGLNTDGDDHYVFWSDRALSSPAAASWSLIATRACYITASLDLGPVISSNKHIFEIKVLDAQGEEVGTAAEPGESTEANQVKALTQQILIPEAGSYTIELRNNRDWGKGAVKNVILAYAADAPAAEPQMKTIYCKIDKAWWKADGAAVGVYTWDDGGNAKAAWPGERMTPVEGEADLWSVELDINTYHMCIFTRVNGEGDVADWGAKTGDLTIPTDEKDLYTITSESAVWGDPGVAGEWSKYEPSAPVVLDAPDAAPVEPTLQGYQVKAVYSAKYSADCSFGEWSSGTAYTQEEFGKKYVTTNSGYFGLEFAHTDCSEMEALHLDAWIAADASIRVVPIHGGTEVGVTVELKGQKWNSIDIALSKFEGVTNWSNVYQIKIDNAANLTFWLNNVYFYTTQEKTVDLVDGYYLIGTMNGWDIHNLKATDKFAVNPENDKEYVLTTALAENAEFKVVAIANNALGAWYPGDGANYKVDFAHAGDSKDIYFRPDYQGGEGWHAGCIYVAENVNTNPYETWFATGDTWNTETESYLEWNEDAKKATVYIKVDKYGQWRAQVKYHGPIAEAGKYYRVALKMKSNNALQNVTIKYQDNAEMIYVADAALEAGVEFAFDQKAAGVAGGNGVMVLDFGFAKAGDVIEIYDVVIEETEAPEPTLADGFYLIGRINGVDGWDVAALKAENKFAPNLENPSEFMLNVTLAENDEIQVVNVLNDIITAWYPSGESNNYVVDANHAGAKTIYFRPDNQGGEDWWHGCIYVAPNHGTGLENTNAAVKAVKVIENGQLYIILNGVRYNALGQME